MKVEPGNFELTPEVHSHLVRNLLKRTKQFTPESVTAGKDWYPIGHEYSQHIGEESGAGTLGGAAILGKLSAGTEWNKNVLQGMQVLNVTDRQANLIRRASEISKESGEENAKQLRARAGLVGTPLNLQTSSNIDAAIKVRNKEVDNPMDVFTEKLSGARKTSDFTYSLASAGEHNAAPVDTHAYDAAMDDYHIPYGTGNNHMKKAGVYNFVQNVYADAHQKALKQGLVPEGTTLPDFQAMHWVHHINNKIKINKNAAKSAKAQTTQTVNLLAAHPDLNPAGKGLPALATRNDHFYAGTGEGKA
jgi:hypothetical protein